VSEHGGGRILRVTLADGRFTVLAEGLDGPEGVARAPDGSLVVAEVGAKRILRIDPADGTRTVLAEDAPIGYPAPPGTPGAYVPTGVAAAGDGSVLFSSDMDAAIYRLVAD
jgi:streptogramin lyase